jgi:hypothetical protein
MTTFRVWLPGQWPSLNEMKDGAQRGGARGGNKWNQIKRAFGDPAQLLIRSEKRRIGIGSVRPMIRGPAFIDYTHRRATRRGDPDNYASAAMKIVSDVLVREGIIENDTFAYVHGFSHRFEFSASAPGLLVEVTG